MKHKMMNPFLLRLTTLSLCPLSPVAYLIDFIESKSKQKKKRTNDSNLVEQVPDMF